MKNLTAAILLFSIPSLSLANYAPTTGDAIIDGILNEAALESNQNELKKSCDLWLIEKGTKQRKNKMIWSLVKIPLSIGASIGLIYLGKTNKDLALYTSIGSGVVTTGIKAYTELKDPFLKQSKKDYLAVRDLVLLGRVQTKDPHSLSIIVDRYRSLLNRDSRRLFIDVSANGLAEELNSAMTEVSYDKSRLRSYDNASESMEPLLLRQFLRAAHLYDEREAGLCVSEDGKTVKSERDARAWTRLFWNCGFASIAYRNVKNPSAEVIGAEFNSPDVGQCAVSLLKNQSLAQTLENSKTATQSADAPSASH